MLSKASLHGFPDRFFNFLCGLLLNVVILHRENLGRDLVPQLEIVHCHPLVVSPRCLPGTRRYLLVEPERLVVNKARTAA